MSANPHFMEYVDGVGADPSRRLGWRVLGWVSVALSVVLVATSLTAYAAYRKLQGNINQEDMAGLLGPDRPKKLNSSMNILLIGSDKRDGANAKYGRANGARSDTIMLLHLSPGGRQATGISFPRDSMVQIPECKKKDGATSPGYVGLINESFNNGGASCTWATIESLTNIRIDHFVQVDFSGFKNVVNALGGVEICLPKSVNDRDSKLRLSAGRHIVKGEHALAYVRTRHALGDGSDLSRIKRQQQFMGSVVKKAMSGDMLTNPSRLYAFLSAATKSMTTDKDLTVDVMKQLAESVKGMSAGKVRFVTVPWEAYPPDPNRVQFARPAADRLFAAIRNDNQIQSTAKPSPSQPSKVPASQVNVRVLNGNGEPGLAQRVADQLTERGFMVTEVGTVSPIAGTQVTYGSGAGQEAATLAGVVPGAQPGPDADGIAGVVDLVIGQNWGGLKAGASTALPRSIDSVNAAQDVCRSG